MIADRLGVEIWTPSQLLRKARGGARGCCDYSSLTPVNARDRPLPLNFKSRFPCTHEGRKTMSVPRTARLVVVWGFLLLPASARAQSETGTVAGVVKDASGAVMP